MRGDSHLAVSLMVAFPNFWIAYNLTTLVVWKNGLIWLLVGLSFGSLLPDVDYSQSKIMYGTWKPLGLIGKYLFYKPMTRILGMKSDVFRDEHRGYLHSLIGCLIASLFFALPFGIWWFLSPLEYSYIPVFLWAGIPIGFLLHLVEDSFTRSGVRWFFPKDRKWSGEARTWSISGRVVPLVIMSIFGILTLVVYLVVYIIQASLLLLAITTAISLLLLGALYNLSPWLSSLGRTWCSP